MESAKVPMKGLAQELLRPEVAASVLQPEQEPRVVASCLAALDIPAGMPSAAGTLEDKPVAGNLVDTPAALAFRVAWDTLEDSPLAAAQDNPWAADSPADNLAEGNLVALASQVASDIPMEKQSAGSQLPQAMSRDWVLAVWKKAIENPWLLKKLI